MVKASKRNEEPYYNRDPRPVRLRNVTKSAITGRLRNLLSSIDSTMPFKHLLAPANPYALELDHVIVTMDEKKIIVAKHIICDQSKNTFDNNLNDEVFDSDNNRTIRVENNNSEEKEQEDHEELNDVVNNFGPEIEEFDEPEEATGNLRRSTRVRMKPAYLRDYVTLASIAKYVDEAEENFDTPIVVNVLSAIELVNKVPLTFDNERAHVGPYLYTTALAKLVQQERISLEVWEEKVATLITAHCMTTDANIKRH
ncbi:hypothetical protein FOCC_FOCC007321 [Frankliniella occidentalis]|nr:hypothetical protein FOCC_FOCC007321 [Frankliniella occidentalis]